MTYDPRVHHRRSIRLRGHDYRNGGAYFVTCCVQGKECLLGSVVETDMVLSECGQLIQRAWAAIPQRFPPVILDAFQVMPNHWHGVLVIPGPGLEPSLAAATGATVIHPRPAAIGAVVRPGQAPALQNSRPSLGDVIGAFKSVSTIAVNRLLARAGQRLLQEDYFEHVIRNVDSLTKIRDYIRTNPARWQEDPENPGRQADDESEREHQWDWLDDL
jgi:REP-associated tyrosine transposase